MTHSEIQTCNTGRRTNFRMATETRLEETQPTVFKNQLGLNYNKIDNEMEAQKIKDKIIKINNVLNKVKSLKLEVLSNTTDKINEIIITPLGYMKSKRKTKDGITYFGFEKKPGDVNNFFYNNYNFFLER